MARREGLPKTGGRKKGTPNRKTLHLSEELEKHGLDVVEQLVRILPALNESERADVLLDLMSFLFPKRKAIEVVPQKELPAEIKINFVSAKNGRPPDTSELTDSAKTRDRFPT